jgi:CRISPR system Cascade subunit CasC
MFMQIHMLQSMPPGNLNRDDTGQPKKCLFGGVTRGRISSQCIKRSIRHSMDFKNGYGDTLACRTTYLPKMIADAILSMEEDFPAGELENIQKAIAKKFVSEKKEADAESADEKQEKAESKTQADESSQQTGQLVFFPPPFAHSIAGLVVNFRKEEPEAYKAWIGGEKIKAKGKGKNAKKEDGKEEDADQTKGIKKAIEDLNRHIIEKSRELTIDIALFGRMTTSDLVINVEAACQVAHAISTHETLIETDYFTAMDDKKEAFATSQTEKAGAAFLGSGETQTFFNAAVYYKYFNVDLDALKKHLGCPDEELIKSVSVFLQAAIFSNPTGKQNAFAAHGLPELVLVEMSKTKRPISYANAFLQPVTGSNLMAASATALKKYAASMGQAYAPRDTQRILLAKGFAEEALSENSGPALFLNAMLKDHPDDLAEAVSGILEKSRQQGD